MKAYCITGIIPSKLDSSFPFLLEFKLYIQSYCSQYRHLTWRQHCSYDLEIHKGSNLHHQAVVHIPEIKYTITIMSTITANHQISGGKKSHGNFPMIPHPPHWTKRYRYRYKIKKFWLCSKILHFRFAESEYSLLPGTVAFICTRQVGSGSWH